MAAEKIGATKAVGTDTLAYLGDGKKDKSSKTTGFLAFNNGTVPMTNGFSPSPSPAGCSDVAMS